MSDIVSVDFDSAGTWSVSCHCGCGAAVWNLTTTEAAVDVMCWMLGLESDLGEPLDHVSPEVCPCSTPESSIGSEHGNVPVEEADAGDS